VYEVTTYPAKRPTVAMFALALCESWDVTAQPFVVPSGAFNLPHRRQRIWIVAHANSGNAIIHKREGEARVLIRPDIDRGIVPNSWYPADRCEAASRLCRTDDGIPNRMDRLRALGNAVVPQVAEWLGHQILAVDTR
jgi:DNA (cytosine-5)-methyltransferase 1